MILTLPERILPSRLPFEPSLSLSFSLTVPPGVDGWDLGCESAVEDVGDKRGWLGDETRGGVFAEAREWIVDVGVGGMKASSGAE